MARTFTQQVTSLTGRGITTTSRVTVQAVQSSSVHAVNAVQSTGNLLSGLSKIWSSSTKNLGNDNDGGGVGDGQEHQGTGEEQEGATEAGKAVPYDAKDPLHPHGIDQGIIQEGQEHSRKKSIALISHQADGSGGVWTQPPVLNMTMDTETEADTEMEESMEIDVEVDTAEQLEYAFFSDQQESTTPTKAAATSHRAHKSSPFSNNTFSRPSLKTKGLEDAEEVDENEEDVETPGGSRRPKFHHVRGGSLEAELDFRMAEVAAAVSAAEREEERTHTGYDTVPAVLPVGEYAGGQSGGGRDRKNEMIWKRMMYPAGRIMHLVPAKLVPGIDVEALVAGTTTANPAPGFKESDGMDTNNSTGGGMEDIRAMEESFRQAEMMEDDTQFDNNNTKSSPGNKKIHPMTNSPDENQPGTSNAHPSSPEAAHGDNSTKIPPESLPSGPGTQVEPMILLDALPQEAYGRIKLCRRVIADHIIPNYLKSLESALLYIHRERIAVLGDEKEEEQQQQQLVDNEAVV